MPLYCHDTSAKDVVDVKEALQKKLQRNDRTLDVYSDCRCSVAMIILGNTYVVSFVLKLHVLYSHSGVLQQTAAVCAVLVGDALSVGNDWHTLKGPLD